jgi:hypothetical protein
MGCCLYLLWLFWRFGLGYVQGSHEYWRLDIRYRVLHQGPTSVPALWVSIRHETIMRAMVHGLDAEYQAPGAYVD